MDSIAAIPNARNIPSLVCYELFNEASLPANVCKDLKWFVMILIKFAHLQSFSQVQKKLI